MNQTDNKPILLNTHSEKKKNSINYVIDVTLQFPHTLNQIFTKRVIMPLDLIGFAYAATVAAGGIMGFYKAGKFCFSNLLFNKLD